jgi:Spy/CpxP family protein refolding chaperone
VTIARAILLTLVLAALAGAAGVWGGARYVQARLARAPALHEMLHLTPGQQTRIEALERDHTAARQALEMEMRAANAELAQAYQETHSYTPKAQAAIDRFHHAMDALQKETLLHVLAMRSVLTVEQTPQFDDTVVKSLTASGP